MSKSSNAPKESQKPSLFDLEKQFEFYGQYHTNITNVSIHIICVPTIFFTALVLSHALPFFPATAIPSLSLSIPAALQPILGSTWTPNMSTLTSLSYATYFIILEPFAGLLYAPFILSLGQWSDVFYNMGSLNIPGVGETSTYTIAVVAFVGSWIAQFIGHGKFEGRAPALFDSLLQSLVLAVFFVFMEVLFALGYRPALHQRMKNRIGKAVLEYRQGAGKARKA